LTEYYVARCRGLLSDKETKKGRGCVYEHANQLYKRVKTGETKYLNKTHCESPAVMVERSLSAINSV